VGGKYVYTHRFDGGILCGNVCLRRRVQGGHINASFEVLTAVTVKVTVVWDVTARTLCIISNVSEQRVTSMFRVEQ
jgi:hypothetical protein